MWPVDMSNLLVTDSYTHKHTLIEIGQLKS